MADYEDRKGDRLVFVKGSYKGSRGWVDKLKGTTADCQYVIVEPKLPNRPHEKDTRVKKTSVKLVEAELQAVCFEEAILEQNPDIDEAFDKLVGLLASCQGVNVNKCGNALGVILMDRMHTASMAQLALGGKAKWRNVDWEENVGQNSGQGVVSPPRSSQN
jgi:hypothetical protein